MASPTPTTSVLKLQLQGVTRRLQLQEPDSISYEGLKELVQSTFSELEAGSAFTLHYLDDEEDLVIVASTEDLQEALHFAASAGLKSLKLTVDVAASSAGSVADALGASQEAEDQEESADQVKEHTETTASDDDEDDEDIASATKLAFADKAVDVSGSAKEEEEQEQEHEDEDEEDDDNLQLPPFLAALGIKPADLKEGSNPCSAFAALRPLLREMLPTVRAAMQDNGSGCPLDQLLFGGRNTAAAASMPAAAGAEETKAQATEPVPGTAAVHRHVSCDGCGQSPIRGIRYKSATSFNFDVCESCEASGAFDDEHVFLKIRSPTQACNFSATADAQPPQADRSLPGLLAAMFGAGMPQTGCAPSPGPFAGPFASPYAGPFGGPFAGPYASPYAGPFGGPFAGPYASPYAGPFGGPFAGGPVGAGPFAGPFGAGSAAGPFGANHPAASPFAGCRGRWVNGLFGVPVPPTPAAAPFPFGCRNHRRPAEQQAQHPFQGRTFTKCHKGRGARVGCCRRRHAAAHAAAQHQQQQQQQQAAPPAPAVGLGALLSHVLGSLQGNEQPSQPAASPVQAGAGAGSAAPGANVTAADPQLTASLTAMGFPEAAAVAALERTGNNFGAALSTLVDDN